VSPGPDIVGKAREAELLAAARELGVREVRFLDYPDGALDQVDATRAIDRIAGHIRRVKPQVVVTFGPDGAYGHPDHIAISQFTTAAIVCAADPSSRLEPETAAPHRVAKLYFIAWSPKKWTAYQAALRALVCEVDGETRQAVPWPEWAITTVVDTSSGRRCGARCLPQSRCRLQEARSLSSTSALARERRSSTARSAGSMAAENRIGFVRGVEMTGMESEARAAEGAARDAARRVPAIGHRLVDQVADRLARAGRGRSHATSLRPKSGGRLGRANSA
jgi:hypothetical protein